MMTCSPIRGACVVVASALLWVPAAAASDDHDDPPLHHEEEHDEHHVSRSGHGPGFELDLTFTADTAFAWYNVAEPLVAGAHDPHRNGFTLQQLELAVGAAALPHLRLDGAAVFSEHGVELEEAYVSTLSLPGGLGLRAGLFLTRFGRANPSHLHDWSFANQVLVVGKLLGEEGNRGAGAEIAWRPPLPWTLELSASAHHIHGEHTARSFVAEHDHDAETEDGHDHDAGSAVEHPRDLQYVVRLVQTLDLARHDTLCWGLSATFGPHGHGRAEIFGTDLTLSIRDPDGPQRLDWQTEAMLRQRRGEERTQRDWGGYTQLVVRFARQWAAGIRYELVSGLEDDELDPQWTALRQRISPQLTFLPVRGARLRLQVDVDNPRYHEQPWQIGGILALELMVGTGRDHHH